MPIGAITPISGPRGGLPTNPIGDAAGGGSRIGAGGLDGAGLNGLVGLGDGAGAPGGIGQPTEAVGAVDGGSSVGGALDSLAGQHAGVDAAAQSAATGDLRSVSEYMVAATEAQLATQLTVAVRDRAVQAFTDVMRMQV